jgi:hypothetical protein
MAPQGHEVRVHLTLTDDHPWAQAFVVLEAIPMNLTAPAEHTRSPEAR